MEDQMASMSLEAVALPAADLAPAAHRLPTELLRQIMNETADWELATTLAAPHDLVVSSPWTEQATKLDWAILSGDLERVKQTREKDGQKVFTQWGARIMTRFAYIPLLDYFFATDPMQLIEQCSALLPAVASAWGRVSVLSWAQAACFPMDLSREDAIDDASRHGNVGVLEWWKKSGLKLRYSEHALSSATIKKEIQTLEWWKHSGLPLKIGNVLDFASMAGSEDLLDWWVSSGLPAKYSKTALYHLSTHGDVPLLDWWKRSPYPLAYDKECVLGATKHAQVEVLQWWLESGLDVEYRWFDVEEALEDSFVAGPRKEQTVIWWKERGFEMGRMTTWDWMKVRKLRLPERAV